MQNNNREVGLPRSRAQINPDPICINNCLPLSQVVLEVLDSNVKRGCAVYETGQRDTM